MLRWGPSWGRKKGGKGGGEQGPKRCLRCCFEKVVGVGESGFVEVGVAVEGRRGAENKSWGLCRRATHPLRSNEVTWRAG